MAKSLRSKIKRRWRKLKRGHLDKIVTGPQLQKLTANLHATLQGSQYREQQPINAFLHPQDPTAQFPQIKMPTVIDLRSGSIPGSGFQWSGAQRKKVIDDIVEEKSEEDENMEEEDKVIKVERGYLKKKKKCGKNKKTIVF